MKLIRRRHLAGIRYAVSVELAEGKSVPTIGDVFSLGDMAVVRVVALRDTARERPGAAGPRELSMTVEALELLARLRNLC